MKKRKRSSLKECFKRKWGYSVINIFIIMIAVIIVCIFSFLLFLWFDCGVVTKVFRIVYNNFWNHYLKRKRIANISEKYYGITGEKGILNKIDKKINGTGWKERYSYLSSELFVAISIILSTIFWFISFLISHKFMFSFAICIPVLFIPWLILYFTEGIRYKKTEKQLMVFINLLENYSRTSDDLIDIISKTELYMDEPLKSAIRKFSWEAKHIGETDAAIKHLTEKIPHRKFKEIIQNLEICRKHDTNYEDVLKDIRVSIQEYLKSKEEKMIIRQNTRGNIMIMMFVGGFIMRLVNGFVEGGLLTLLSSNFIGILIITYIVLVVLTGIWQLVKIDRN